MRQGSCEIGESKSRSKRKRKSNVSVNVKTNPKKRFSSDDMVHGKWFTILFLLN